MISDIFLKLFSFQMYYVNRILVIQIYNWKIIMNTCLIKIKFNYDHWWWQVKVSSLQESFPLWFAETLPRDIKLPIKEKRAEKLICF